MGTIHLPPGTIIEGQASAVIQVCVSSSGGDTLEIDIGHFGLCLHAPNGYFVPELPSGAVSASQKYISSPLVSAGTSCLAYLDSTTGNLFLFAITIQPSKCPDDTEDS
jgi:hypothetical protein